MLSTRQGAALRSGADPVHAFVDGYHLGLWVTIALLAAGVAVSYLTLRPRTAAQASPAATAPPAAVPAAARESVSVAELTTVDELAADLLAPGEMTR